MHVHIQVSFSKDCFLRNPMAWYRYLYVFSDRSLSYTPNMRYRVPWQYINFLFCNYCGLLTTNGLTCMKESYCAVCHMHHSHCHGGMQPWDCSWFYCRDTAAMPLLVFGFSIKIVTGDWQSGSGLMYFVCLKLKAFRMFDNWVFWRWKKNHCA